jgi:regulatory protein
LIQKGSAWERALKYLVSRPRTEKQIRDYLVSKRYEEREIEETVERLKAANYVNDDDFARGFARARAEYKYHGRYRILRDLAARGITGEAAKEKVEEMLKPEVVEEQIEKAVAKWIRAHGMPTNLKELTHLHNFLFRLGYEPALIKKKLMEFKTGNEER